MSLSEHRLQIPVDSMLKPGTEGLDDAVRQSSVKQSNEELKDIAFGSVAGICGKIFEYPFDTVKVRLQSQPSIAEAAAYGQNGGILYTGPIDCFRKSIASGGVRSLYRGISAPLFGAAVETSSLFFSYGVAQKAVGAVFYPERRSDTHDGKISLPFGALLFCGAASGAFTSLLLTPIELVKCQIQAEPIAGVRTTYNNPLAVIASVWKNHGLLGFWRGQMGTLIRETGGSAAWFGANEGVKSLLKDWSTTPSSVADFKAPFWHKLLAGACAGISYNFLFYPADTIKSRMQTEQVDIGSLARTSTKTQRPSFWSVGRNLWRSQGLKGMYRGCGITVLRSAPASAIIFTTYDWLHDAFP